MGHLIHSGHVLAPPSTGLSFTHDLSGNAHFDIDTTRQARDRWNDMALFHPELHAVLPSLLNWSHEFVPLYVIYEHQNKTADVFQAISHLLHVLR